MRQVVPPRDLETIVSNIGLTPDLSSLFTPNAGMHTAFVQVGLKEDHKASSFAYMDEVRARVAVASRTCGLFFNPVAWWMRCLTRAPPRRSMSR